MLRAVAEELLEYADSLEREGTGAEFEGSTYTMEAAGAVYELMQLDGYGL